MPELMLLPDLDLQTGVHSLLGEIDRYYTPAQVAYDLEYMSSHALRAPDHYGDLADTAARTILNSGKQTALGFGDIVNAQGSINELTRRLWVRRQSNRALIAKMAITQDPHEMAQTIGRSVDAFPHPQVKMPTWLDIDHAATMEAIFTNADALTEPASLEQAAQHLRRSVSDQIQNPQKAFSNSLLMHLRKVDSSLAEMTDPEIIKPTQSKLTAAVDLGFQTNEKTDSPLLNGYEVVREGVLKANGWTAQAVLPSLLRVSDIRSVIPKGAPTWPEAARKIAGTFVEHAAYLHCRNALQYSAAFRHDFTATGLISQANLAIAREQRDTGRGPNALPPNLREALEFTDENVPHAVEAILRAIRLPEGHPLRELQMSGESVAVAVARRFMGENLATVPS